MAMIDSYHSEPSDQFLASVCVQNLVSCRANFILGLSPGGPSRSAEMTLDDFLEGALEVFVEVRVNDGVEQRVGVTEPVNDILQPAGHVARLLAEWHDEGDDEERQPAEDEGAHDDAQSLHRLALPCHRDLPLRLGGLLVPALEQRHRGRGVGQRQVAFGVAVNFDDLQRLAVLRVFHRAVDARQRPGLHAPFPGLALRVPGSLFVEQGGR